MNLLTLKGPVYNALKWFTLVLLPAFGTLYLALAGTWDLSHADEVAKTCVILATFLGAILGISAVNYNNSDAKYDGTAFVDKLDPTNNPDVMLKDPNADKAPKELLLKVQETQPPPS